MDLSIRNRTIREVASVEGLLNFFVNYKIADMAIGLIGLYALTLILDRFKALFFDYALPVGPFMNQVSKLIREDKIDEALTFCAANEKKPLAHVIKRVLEKSDREEHAIAQSLDIASSEIAPKLVRRLGQVQMVSNVVTLVGLLGTVIGLIVAFKAISFADVSQKQTILAQGISIAMTATAAALIVAIPTMFAYTFLYEKQNRLFSQIDENSQKIMEMLSERAYSPVQNQNIYPTDLRGEKITNKEKTPPPPGSAPKAS